jgi:peptidyl-prolyl cis-trans isomerase B (cyclophilin B)
VSSRRECIVACFCLFVLVAAAGCNRSGDSSQPPAADIKGPSAASPAAGDTRGTAAKTGPDRQHPVVVIETEQGNITLQLDGEKAPLTVQNFVAYVAANHYDNTLVHQIYKGQVWLAGGYGPGMVEKRPGTAIFNEAHNGLQNRRGTIAMARLPDAVHSATSQFYINLADNPALDHKDRSDEGYGYCVFGKVTEGMDVADRIGSAPVHDTPDFDHTPVPPVAIKSIRLR